MPQVCTNSEFKKAIAQPISSQAVYSIQYTGGLITLTPEEVPEFLKFMRALKIPTPPVRYDYHAKTNRWISLAKKTEYENKLQKIQEAKDALIEKFLKDRSN